MKKLRGFILVLCVAVFAFCNTAHTAAVTLDGVVDAREEWAKMPMINVAESGTDNDIMFMAVRYDLQTKNCVLYLAFQMVQNHANENLDNCGYVITINNSSPIRIFPDKCEYNDTLYGVKATFTQQYDGASVEAKIVFNQGIGQTIDLRFIAYDSFGQQSKQFKVTMKDEPDELTSAARETSKTTTQKTTKLKTTKAKTTAKSKSSSRSKTQKKTANVYSTVNPDDYKKLTEQETQIISENADTAEKGTEKNKKINLQKQEGHEVHKTVIKAVSAAVAGISVGALIMTVKKKKK